MTDQATTDPQQAENQAAAQVVGAIVGAGLVPAQVEPEPTQIADQASPPESKGEGEPPAATATPTPEQTRIAALEAEVARIIGQLTAEQTAHTQTRDGLTQAGQVLKDSLGAAAARYRDLAARSNPEVPAELITGTTIDQVDQSIEAGKAVVAKVRAQLAAQATAAITPGAPVRDGADVEALSPLDKIKYAVTHRK